MPSPFTRLIFINLAEAAIFFIFEKIFFEKIFKNLFCSPARAEHFPGLIFRKDRTFDRIFLKMVLAINIKNMKNQDLAIFQSFSRNFLGGGEGLNIDCLLPRLYVPFFVCTIYRGGA
jgi:hypothetical protein